MLHSLTPPPVTNCRDLEGNGWEVPERAFRPTAEQSPATAVVCTRLAQNLVLGDPGDFGGNAVVELVAPDGTRERFAQFMAFHKSDSFEFGFGGSGPSALAANILGLLLSPREAWRLHQDFKAAVVARVPRDGGEIPMADVRAWVEAYWAEERADDVLMHDEEEQRALAAASYGTEENGAAEGGEPADDEAAGRTVTAGCAICHRTATAVLPPVLGSTDFQALVARVHTRATCGAWRTASLRWPDGRAMVVEIPG